jgi:hypothetical protein
MPDITMCKGENCPKKETCYRYRAIPSEHRQSYFVTSPIKDDVCEYYWKIEKTDRLREEHEEI